MLNEIFDQVKTTPAFIEGFDVLSQNSFATYRDDGEDVLCDESEWILDKLFSVESWNNGISKVVLIYEDYVLKTAITNYYVEDYDDDGEPLEQWSTIERQEPDYCEIEFQLFEIAKKWGISHFFADTIYLEDGVYMQEKVEATFNQVEFPDFRDRKFEQSFYEKDSHYISSAKCLKYAGQHHLMGLWKSIKNASIFVAYIELYPLFELRKLSAFFKKYDINDLHTSNLGWVGKELKLIDFSGYMTLTYQRIAAEQ